jgi:predicted  nucleic acid-binding Zn-ribbon protein
MNKTLSANDRDRMLDILNYWHKIEFFLPFDLDAQIAECDDWQIHWLHSDALADENWSLWKPNIPDTHILNSYSLYLGIFDKAECAQVYRQFGAVSLGSADEFEDAERADLEGSTCFAKVKLSVDGVPCFERLSISTLPWALGRAQESGLSSLGYDAFETAKLRLSELLANFRSDYGVGWEEESSKRAIANSEIIGLHGLLCEWAGYVPADCGRLAVLVANTTEKRSAMRAQKTEPDRKIAGRIRNDAETLAALGDSEQDEEDEDSIEPEIDILNSFFIRDIELAIAFLRAGDIPQTLAEYLAEPVPENRIDLYSDIGRQKIIDILHPKRLNRAHWFDKPENALSLMQQFAINIALDQAAGSSLFSVNGPPGTGKTTLLRDIFAENIVRRAKVLASLATAADAFEASEYTHVHFNDRTDASKIRVLKPALTGFEMVVASTNNAAVENISVDLPKRDSLREPWRSQKYLQAVAYKVAAQKNEWRFVKLAPGDVPWGLISCVLGKARNRHTFKERFIFMADKREKELIPSETPNPQTIIQWIDNYQGPSFSAAKKQFRLAWEAVSEKLESLARFAELHSNPINLSEGAFAADEVNALNHWRRESQRIQKQISEMVAKRSELNERCLSLKEHERLLDRSAPGMWAKLLRRAEARTHRQQIRENASEQRAILREIARLRHDLDELGKQGENAANACSAAENALQKKREIWTSKKAELEDLSREFGGIESLANAADLETADVQKKGLWYNQELTVQRTELFAAALSLHEAWLAEVGRSGGGFRGNIYSVAKLLSNKQPDCPSHVPLIWQSLFMIVPVVSTTFASFANQFRNCGPGDIGWLFIDEAGQGVPQAAVGALWRANRAIIVGDPLQIEPVFTLPSRLISALSGLSPHTRDLAYAPNKISIQKLGDGANRYGTYLGSEDSGRLWIGSPLRVHRRCINPMFDISNCIAYEGKMIFGLEESELPDGPPIPCGSAWIDVGGQVRSRQEVPGQTRLVVELIVSCYARDQTLPALYVITPFRAIKKAISEALENADWSKI